MNLIIESTKIFETEMNKILSKSDIIDRINNLIIKLETAKYECDKISDIHAINMPVFEDIKSKIYIYRVTQDYRIIFSVDVDNIFNQVIVTLYGITKPNSYKKLVNLIIKSQKQQFGVYNYESK